MGRSGSSRHRTRRSAMAGDIRSYKVLMPVVIYVRHSNAVRPKRKRHLWYRRRNKLSGAITQPDGYIPRCRGPLAGADLEYRPHSHRRQ